MNKLQSHKQWFRDMGALPLSAKSVYINRDPEEGGSWCKVQIYLHQRADQRVGFFVVRNKDLKDLV